MSLVKKNIQVYEVNTIYLLVSYLGQFTKQAAYSDTTYGDYFERLLRLFENIQG